jgi:murein DD-endopeptidase MepM/ murein hydrolase activator NlpD
LRYKLRNLALIGLSAVLLGACASQPDTSAKPVMVVPTPVASAADATSDAATPSAGSTAAAGKAGPTPSPTPKEASKPKVTYVFPVVGNNSYAHTHHDYPATDVITKCGNRVRAVTSGTILAITTKDIWKPSVNAGATRGGLSVSLLGDDGVRYYGSHLSVIDAKVEVGVRVTAGQTLGQTGDTGDASACHLHFGISPPCAKTGDWWNQRGTLYPWPYLDSWKKGGQKSAVAAVKAWQAKHGCPTKPTVDK